MLHGSTTPRSLECLYKRPPNRRSSLRNGQYNSADAVKATSKPMSPVYLAIGPVYQTCSIDGTISATDSRPAAKAGRPYKLIDQLNALSEPANELADGSFRRLSQAKWPYEAGSRWRKHTCSTSTMPQNADDQ